MSPSNEGAGNAGCALHPRSRVQRVERKSAHEHTGAAENIRHSLRNGFTAYIALTPEYRAFSPPSPHGNRHSARSGLAPPQDLTPTIEASGPHDFAVRFGTARQHVLRPLTEFIPPCNPVPRTMPPRPPHPIPTFGDDGQRPFLRGQDGGSCTGDLGFGKSEILPDGLICRRGVGWNITRRRTCWIVQLRLMGFLTAFFFAFALE